MPVHMVVDACETLLRTNAENSSAVLWCTDSDLRISDCCGGGLDKLASSPEMLIGASLDEFFQTRGSDSSIFAAHRQALSGGVVAVEFRWGECVFRGYVAPQRNGEMDIAGCTGYAQQIAVGTASEEALRASEDRYRRLLAAVTAYTYCVRLADGLPVATEHGPGCTATTGYTPDEYAADASLWINMVPPEDQGRVQAHIATLFQQQSVPPIEHRIRRKDGKIRWVRDTIVCHFDDAGALTRYDGLVEDITDRIHAEQTLRENVRFQTALNSLLELSLQPLSLEEHLERSLDVLFSVPWIALESRGAVYLLEDEPPVLAMKAQRGLPDLLLGLCGHVQLGRCLCGKAAETGRIVFANCVNGRHEICYAGIRPHGHFCVPIMSGNRVLGVINLYVKHAHEKKPEEESFLAAVANVLAGVIDRKQYERTQREREGQLIAAQRIQQHILPRCPPSLPGFDIAGALVPAEYAAGDYFDYLTLPGGSVGIVVGDVSGHGFSSALLMASTSAHLRSFAEEHADVGQILRHTNASLCREVEEDRFVTLLFVRVEPSSRTLYYGNAGHPAGWVLDGAGNVKATLESGSFPLAVFPDMEFPVSGPVQLESNDVVLLTTDGIPEAHSPANEFFGTKRMLDVVRGNRWRQATEIIQRLQQAVRDFSRRAMPQDDLTVVVIKVEP